MVTLMVLDENVISWSPLVAVSLTNIASILTLSLMLKRALCTHIIHHLTIISLIFIVLDHRFNIVQHRLSPS